METKKSILKKTLLKVTGCDVQHNGWCCGTCFFAISKVLTNSDWQNVLLIRGDSKRADLNNLPKDEEESYKKIIRLCNERLNKEG